MKGRDQSRQGTQCGDARTPFRATISTATLGIILPLLVGPACVTSRDATTRDIAGPESIVHAIIAADNQADLDAVMRCYTHDAQWIKPDGSTLSGRAQLREHYRQTFDEYDCDMAATIEDVEAASHLAVVRGVITGHVKSRKTNEPLKVHDRFLSVHRRSDGRWPIAWLMWTPIEIHPPEDPANP